MITQTLNKQINLEDMETSLSDLRLTQPAQQEKMYRSLQRLGQLTPVIVRKDDNKYQIIDGFKRHYAAERLGWDHLQANILDIPIAHGKAMILNYNRANRSLLDYDEALVVYSLKKDHVMDQAAIAALTGYSRSWVSRRLALIEKLAPCVQEELRLGLISNTQARAIVKLPRGNQQAVMVTIIEHDITSRESALLVEKYLQSANNNEREYMLKHPREVLMQNNTEEIYDTRLSHHGNRLFKCIELLLVQQSLFIGIMSNNGGIMLNDIERGILVARMDRLRKGLKTILLIVNEKLNSHEGREA